MTKRTALTPALKAQLAIRAAEMSLDGWLNNRIAKELNVNPLTVKSLLDHPAAEKFLTEIQDKTMRMAVARIRYKFAKMAPDMFKAVQAQLKKNNMEAVKTILKVMGALDIAEDNTNKDTGAINIIFPTNTQPKDVPVEIKVPGRLNSDGEIV